MSVKSKTCITIWWQWWDEWKWKLVDYLSSNYDIVVRSWGWANAGHTIYVHWVKTVLHLIPSWVLQWKQCVITNWCVIDLLALLDEIHELDKLWINSAKLLKISDRAHVVFSFHKEIDEYLEKWSNLWTTKRWIWPTYMFKSMRKGIRVWDIVYDFEWFSLKLREIAMFVRDLYWIDIDIESEILLYKDIVDAIEWMVEDTSEFLYKAKQEWKEILFEWAQWALLDIDQWTYPYVTSSNTISAWAMTWSWFDFQNVDKVIAIVKAYTTRVWNWPFPSELLWKEGDDLREKGAEYWATTWRPRRCWWLDLVLLRRVCQESWVNSINLTKLDVLTWSVSIKAAVSYKIDWKEVFQIPLTQKDIDRLEIEYFSFEVWNEDISKVRRFSDLPKNAQSYIKYIEKFVWVSIDYIWVWVDREDLIDRT